MCLFAYYMCVILELLVWVCVCVCSGTHVSVIVDGTGRLWVYSLIAVHLYIFEIGPLTEPEAHWFGWSLSFEMRLSLYSLPSTGGIGILPHPTFYKAPGTQTQVCAGSTLLTKPILQQPSSCFSKWLCISAGSSIPVPWPPFHPRAPPFHAPIPAPHCSLC